MSPRSLNDNNNNSIAIVEKSVKAIAAFDVNGDFGTAQLIGASLRALGVVDADVSNVLQVLSSKFAARPPVASRAALERVEEQIVELERFLAAQVVLSQLVRCQQLVRGFTVRRRLGRLDTESRAALRRTLTTYRELVANERVYVQSLGVAVEHYLIPLRRETANVKTQLLPQQTLAAVFSCIEQLHQVHVDLLADLVRIRDENWPFLTSLGDVFLKLAPRLDCYGFYVSTFTTAMVSLDAALADNAKFARFVETTFHSVSTSQNLWVDLRALLALPLNRLTKYETTLHNISQDHAAQTLGGVDAARALDAAHGVLKSTAALVRTRLEQATHLAALETLLGRLRLGGSVAAGGGVTDGVSATPIALITDTRRIVKQGELRSATSNRWRHMVALNDLCILATPGKNNALQLKYACQWREAEVRKGNEKSGLQIDIVAQHPRPIAFSLLCANATECGAWLTVLQELVDSTKPNRTFGIAIETLIERDSLCVPSFMLTIANVISRRLDLDGVFRLSGSADELRKTALSIDNGRIDDIDWEKRDPHLAPALLKQWLRDLPDPLFTFKLYSSFIHMQQQMTDDGKLESPAHLAALRDLLAALPPAHYDVARALFHLLARVGAASSQNRMAPMNLAIVFGPTVMCPRVESFETTLAIPGVSALCCMMIERAIEVFPEQQPLKRKN
jgi:hypothetical protein